MYAIRSYYELLGVGRNRAVEAGERQLLGQFHRRAHTHLLEHPRAVDLDGAHGNVQLVRNHVITSYSIHYTKLYDVALTNPGWLMQGLADMDDIRILHFSERAWDDHQDVVVFGKPAVNV